MKKLSMSKAFVASLLVGSFCLTINVGAKSLEAGSLPNANLARAELDTVSVDDGSAKRQQVSDEAMPKQEVSDFQRLDKDNMAMSDERAGAFEKWYLWNELNDRGGIRYAI